MPSAAGLRAAPDFQREVLPVLTQYCSNCHSTEKQKGDLDLERFQTPAQVKQHTGVWEHVLEQMANNEMPPKNKPQLPPDKKELLTSWVRSALDEAALESAGDPGPVVLRRLSNVEYTYTVRDLTGLDSLDPAHEFPVDGAAGEGFTNAGAGLVMSPSLVTKYFDAAKEIAAHAVLLPDGIRFSPNTSQRDWTDESLAAIRGFYSRWTVPGGGSAVNLQGIKFDTADGGVLPLEKYIAATLTEREALTSGSRSISDAAAAHGLNAKYLGTLWTALSGTAPSFLLDQLRGRWRSAAAGDAPALMACITPWQQALWRFTQVGQIGKRDSAKNWQVPVGLLEESREIRLKIPPPSAGGDGAVSVFLSASDAGDGGGDDLALWENPRLVIPGRPDLPLRDAGAAMQALSAQREALFGQAVRCLAAAAEPAPFRDPATLSRLAAHHRVDPRVLETWLKALGLNAGEATIDSHLTQRLESAENYAFVKGWTGPNALGVLANPTDHPVRVPGLIKAHGLSVHPAPDRCVVAGWRSPVAGTLKVEAVVQDGHTACGNGFTWAVQLRQGNSRRQLASGIVDGTEPVKTGPLENIAVQSGDVLALVIGPRDGNHVCDMTPVDLTITDGSRSWDLAKEVSTDILAGNPHADAAGNAGVWHFFSEPDNGASQEAVVPPGSLLARWYEAGTREKKDQLAEEFQKLLLNGPSEQPAEAPDAALHRQLASVNGPLLGGLLRKIGTPAAPLPPAPEDSPWGLKPSLFGTAAAGVETPPASLCVHAPSVLEVRLPADLLAAGAELAATARLHPSAGPEGSVQMRMLTAPPASAAGPVAELPKELGAKTKWSDGEQAVAAGSPILVRRESAAWQRLDRACGEFRDLFPAALCYTKIVPVDEVVTLTLFYREDDQLKRLLLDDAQAAELDQLWNRLHYVSQDALKLVDAYEQLYQFATQDADPSAFAALREPIQQRAEAFKKQVATTLPAHLDAVLALAENAWRRPLTEADRGQLLGLYQRLLKEEIPHEDAIRLTLARVLVAPAFLYRGEQAPAGLQAGAVNDWELATRLSYFLTSSAPDTELRATAAAGTLHRSEVLKAQTRRLMRSPAARRLATEFGCQWLQVRDVETLDEKSERHFPSFVSMRSAMQEEVVRFFMDLFQEDRAVLSLLNADHTFVNGALAKHYGLDAGGTPDWHRVEGMRAHGRGGILGFAATLSKQSGASRTSPILRGNWLNEVVLGDRLPRPPKGIPVLPEETLPGLTERQLIERHSSDANCARCHQRIDPFGFALEGFDAIGRLRQQDAAGLAIDTATTLPDGTPLSGMDGLRDYLLNSRRDDFLRQFCHKLLGYALGRGVQLSDKPLLEAMTAALKSGDGRVSQALDLIVTSPQFLQIRGRDFPVASN
ncbi:MAG: DUF1592 domain-containing protein [Verrucomicrobiaceae bacterium]|nr:MAG: DUF1592 domain-containing protein [Verrucomicrobiaceae bacterium]